MKKVLFKFLVVFGLILIHLYSPVFGQNPPSFGSIDKATLFINSGINVLFIPEVSDNDAAIDQAFDFNITSSDESVLTINSVDYTAGNKVAVLYLSEKGKLGTSTITIEANDGDGIATFTFEVEVVNYSNYGINFEIHDMVFWQQNVPLKSNPAFTMIAPDGKAPYDLINLDSLNLSVYSDCTTAICTGHDFFTSFFRGYVIPPVSGSYKFYTQSGDHASLAISTDNDFDNSNIIIHTSKDIGTPTGGENKEYVSAEIELEAGKVYAIYCVKWNIHTYTGGMLWEGPGITKSFIEGKYLTYTYDGEKPTVPSNIQLITTGFDDFKIDWDSSTDDQQLEGYYVYKNGIRLNELPITESTYTFVNLLSNTTYSVAVTAIDLAGNESLISEVISTTTYGADSIPPTPPTSIAAKKIADIAATVEWSGATDNETEIRGYWIFLNGELLNTEELVYENSFDIYDLRPQTTYSIDIIAVDAGKNSSVKSDTFSFITNAFDPFDISFGSNKARMNVEFEAIGRSAGIGVNVDYQNGNFNNDTNQLDALKELKTATIRWGGINANSLNFSEYIGTSRPHNITIAEFITIANEIGAYPVFTCGVDNSTDWMSNPETFTQFLEYLSGSASTSYGAIRVAEGYEGSLLENCKGLIFELGNEVWGSDAHDAQIGSDYEAYGNWAREMAELMRSSEYFDSEKISLVYSGRHPHPDDSYGLNRTVLSGDNGQVDWLALSGYLGGNFAPEIESGNSELGYYKNGIATMNHSLEGLILTMKEMVDQTGTIKPSFFYEANMTTDSYFGKVGQAIVQTDYYSEMVEHGGCLPTIFHFTSGQWKMTIPAQDNKKLSLYETTKLYNHHCVGNILQTTVESAAVLSDANGNEFDLDPVSCHTYTEGEDYGLLLISRDFTQEYTVQLNLPDEFQFAENATKYIISGESYSSIEYSIDSSSIVLTDQMVIKVPPFSMVVIAFTGDDQKLDLLPLGYFNYVRAESIQISPKDNDGFDINKLRASKTYVAEFEPTEALIKIAEWEIVDNGVDIKTSITGNELRINSTGKCEGNGTILIRAISKDNNEILDEAVVNISNQGNCDTGSEELQNGGWKLFPNPVSDNQMRIVNSGLAEKAEISIADVKGRKIVQTEIFENVLLVNTSSWDKGVYVVSIKQNGNSYILKVLLQ